MKQTFTKTLNILLLMITCLLAGFHVNAQSYTVSTLETGKQYTGMARDNAGSIYVIRATGTPSVFELVKYVNGDPSNVVPIYNQLHATAPDYSWGVTVNDNGDVFVTKEDNTGWKILKFAAGTYAMTQMRSGAYYTALAVENDNDLLAMEFYNHGDGITTNDSYRLMRYTAGSENLGGTQVYDGFAYPTNTQQFTYPWGIAVDGLDNIYILDRPANGGGALIKLSPPNYNTPVTVASGKNFTSVTVDAQNNVYTLEAIGATTNYQVVKYGAPTTAGQTGTAITTSPATTFSSATNQYPWGLAVSDAGDIYVNDGFAAGGGRMLKLTPPPINVTSITRVTTTPSNANSVDFLITFDNVAAGVSTSNFTPTVPAGSITGASIASVTGSGNTRTVTVNTGTGNGTLRLDMANKTGISPNVATAMPFITGQTILIDKTAPTGTIAISNGAAYATTTAVTLNLTGTESGGAGGLQMAFSANGTTYSAYEAFAATKAFTLATGDGVKTVYMRLRDAAGNEATFQDNITLDMTVPETGIALGPDDPTNSTSATFDLFSDDAAATFELQLDGAAYTPATDPITFTGLAAGSHTINVRAIDPAGNIDLSPESYTWFIDLTAPTVSSVSVPANGTYGTGQQLNFTVVYNEAVTVTGTPSFPVTIGGTTVNATYVAAGSTSTNLIFRYTVQAGTFDNNGIVASGPIVLNGGTIVDAATNPANLALNSIGNTTAVLVDAVGPVVTSVTVPANDTYIIGEALNFTVNFDESVTVTGTPSFPVTIGSNTVQATYASGTGSNALLFRYTVQAGDDDNDGIAVGSAIALNGGTMIDALANNATLTLNNVGNTTGVLVDTRMPVPTISSSETFPVTGPFTITITFDMPVTGTLIAGEFTSLNATLSAVTQVNSTTWTALITPPPGQQTGSGSVRLGANAVTSVAGNNSMPSNTYNISWDTKVPAITVTPPANQYYKAGDVISFTISYDEDVIVTGAPTLPIIIDGTTRQAAYTAGADARTLIFSYTVAAGEQDMDGIDLDANIALNGGSIKDAAGNNAPTGVANHYAGILVDGRAPTVTAVAMPGAGPTPSGYYNAGTTLVFTVTTSETVTVSGAPRFDVIIGSTTRQAEFVSNAGNQLTFIYNIVDGDNDEDGITIGTQITFPPGSFIRDAAANNMVATLNGVGDGSGIRINTNHPTVTITPPQPSTVVAPFLITVTFSEQTTDALALADFVLSGCTISALNTSDNISWTGLITPTANAQGAGSIQLPADVVHNIATNGNQASAVFNFNYDMKSPAISGITSPGAGVYKAGDVLTYSINYDDNFTVVGNPALPIIIGSNIRHAALTGSSPSSLTFSYTIVNGDEDLDGIATGNILLNGGAIKDPVGHDAELTTTGSYPSVLVDGVIPTVTSVDVPANGYYRAGNALEFKVHTSEDITVTGTPILDVNIGGVIRTAALTGGSGSNLLTFAYTVVAGDNDADGIALGALNLNGGTLQDPNGNNMNLTLNGVAPTTGVFVNTVIPTVTLSAPTVFNGPWDMTISFSEPVTIFTETDISVTNADLGSLTVVDSKTYTINIDPQADGTVTVSVPANGVVNIGGNPNSASNIITYTFDGTAPTVTSVAVPPNGTYTNSDVINFIANFSENVTVTGTPSLPVTIGAATVQATYTGGTGTNALTFSYSIQNGDYDADGIAVGAAIALNGGTMQDDVTNNATLTLNSVGNTTAVLVDAVPPAITSVNVPANGYYNAGNALIFTVDFNENVTVTGTPSVPVIIGGNTVQATYTGGTGTNALTFRYTVVAGDNDMDGIAVGSTLALNGGTVKDGLGNDAALALNSVGNTDNVFVNTIIPVVTLSGTPVLNGPWTMTITFSEAMTGFAGTDISITNATTSAPVTSDDIVYTVLVTPQANGPVSLSIPANIAEQQTGGNGNAPSNPINYTFDGIAPTVTSVNVPTSGGYNAGDVLNFTVNFDENVAVTGTPSVPVTIGAATVQATYVSGSGTAALTFSYTVQNGENDPDGITLGAAIALNGGTIQDLSTNNAVLTLNGIGNTSGVIVDAVAPVITSVTVPAAGHYKGGQQLDFTVHFSENVTPTAVSSIPVTIGSTVVEADYVNGSGTNGLNFTYTVQPGDADLDGITVGNAIALNGGTITDGVGNNAVLTLNNVGNTSGVIIYNLVPAVVLSGTPVLNGPWTMTITFSEAVTGFDLTDITVTNATLGTLSTSDNITYTTLVTAGGDGAVSLSVPANIAMNIVNNGNTASNTITYTHDGTAPLITSVNVPANGTYNSGDVLNFTANFNENVTVTGTPSLPVQIGATVVQAAYTGGSGSSALNFSYTVLSGQEDNDGIGVGAALGLNGGTIKDAAANNAVLTLNAVGNTSAVLVDALAPVISSVTVPANGYYKAGDELNFTVQFTEPVVSAGSTATLPVTIGATTVQAAIFSTPTTNSIVFRYVVQTGEVDLDGITAGTALVPGGTAIRDAAGNNASLTLNNVGSTSNVFVLANRPTVDITGAISLTQPWTATITFSHAVTGFALTDITLINATASNLQTNDNITYTALISPVIEGGVSIEVLANVAQDAAGNQNLPSARTSYYYDPNPPVITSIEVPANGYYKQGDVLNFAANWNEVVRNSLSPSSLTLPVIIGGTTVQAAYTGGFTTQRITFAYTVQAGEMDLDGIQLGTALQLTNASERLTDQTGNNANLTLNNVANTSGVFVHTARPSVTLSSAAATRVNAPFSVTITFNEAVTQLALTDFTLTNATVSSLQTTDNTTYTVLVTPSADGAATISLPADAAVNVVGNGNTASNSITRTYDATPPAIAAGQSFTVSQYSAAGTVVGTVTATDASGTVQNWALATDGSGGALQISTAGVISVRNTTLLDALVGTDVTLGVTVSDGLNTSTAVPVTVRVVFVNQPPALNVISNVTLCKDVQTHTIQLTGASATEPGQTYTITATSNRDIFDVLSVGAGDVLSYRLKADAPAGTATVAVTIRDNGGTTGGAVDSLRRTFTITVNALPVVNITSDKGASVSKGDIVKLTATGGSTYVWTTADGIISGQRTPVLEVRPMVNTTYEVTAASAAGCTATGSFALSVVTDFKVDAVNILTPNGDGRNDRWVIRNLDSYQDNEVKIFDRAGRLIYSRRNYSNDWDGTVNGSPLAEGTYYYILTIQNGAKTATGYITIVRDRY